MPQMPTTTSDKDNCGPPHDPVNLVFHASAGHGASAADVKGALAAHHWTTPGWWHLQLPAVDAYICDSGPTGRSQDEQAVKPIDWRSRYHVRLWNYGGAAIGSAHAETVSLQAGGHVVMAFESGEQEVAIDLRGAGWQVQRDSVHMQGLDRSPFDSGRATELTP